MDWEACKGNVTKIKHLQRTVFNVSDTLFQPDLFKQKAVAVLSFLTKEYKLNTQRTYLTALSKIDPIYKEHLSELNKAYVVSKNAHSPLRSSEVDYLALTKQINSTIENPRALLGLRIMCALIKYDLDVSLLQMIKTRFIPGDNYYDGKVWNLDNQTKVYPPGAFNMFVADREYLVIDTKGQPYEHIQSLSKSFQTVFHTGFVKTKTMFKNPPVKKVLKLKKTPLPKIKLKLKKKVLSEFQVAKYETGFSKIVLKSENSEIPNLPKKLKLKPKQPEMKSRPWTDYNDPSILPESNETHLTKVKGLTMVLTGKDDRFYYSAFEAPDALARIRSYLENPHSVRQEKAYTFETQKNYINSLCKFISKTPEFNAAIYDTYSAYQRELKLKTICRERPKVVPFLTLVPALAKVVSNKKLVPGFRIICALILNNINLAEDSDNDETPGVLRMSDLKYTRFQDDGEHSYIDLNGKQLHIKSKYTKNKEARSIALPANFITNVKEIYPGVLPEWLLINKSGERYDTLSSLSNMFQKYLQVKFVEVRASYTTYRHSTANASTVGELTDLCHTMGHSMRTAQAEYVRN